MIEPVAIRFDFDGYGWSYIDNGSGPDWKTQRFISGAEQLYTAEALAEARAEERAKNMALLRNLAAKATKVADEYRAAGRKPEFGSMLLNSAEAFETAAFVIEAGEDGA